MTGPNNDSSGLSLLDSLMQRSVLTTLTGHVVYVTIKRRHVVRFLLLFTR
jgi:hypothetical protein